MRYTGFLDSKDAFDNEDWFAGSSLLSVGKINVCFNNKRAYGYMAAALSHDYSV